MKKPPIVNVDEAPQREHRHGDRFEARFVPLSRQLGARKLGYRLCVVPPGKSAWPLHRHYGNEEMLFMLEGEGTLRLDDRRHRLRPGDTVALHAGGPAHELLNSGQSPLRYLAVSTMESPDAVEYPDSGKIGIMAGTAPGEEPSAQTMRFFGRVADGVDYWEGEH